MKRNYLLLIAFILWTITAMAGKNSNYIMGALHLQNGEVKECSSINLPNSIDRSITITTDIQRRNKEKVLCDDIEYMEIWLSNTPDVKNYLFCVHVASSTGQVQRVCLLEASSAWGMSLSCGTYYSIDPKTGKIYGVVVSNNGAPAIISHYLLRKGTDVAVSYASNQTWNPSRRTAADLFAANQTIYDGIVGKKLKTTDIQYILDEMAVTMAENPQNEDSDIDVMPAPSQVQKAETTDNKHKIPNGIDSEYERRNNFSIYYENYFSAANQYVGLSYDYCRPSFLRIGVHTALKTLDNPTSSYDSNNEMKTEKLWLIGIHFAGRLPIRINGYYIIPEISVNPSMAPMSIMKSGVLMDIPLRVGADFEIPLKNEFYGLGLGVYFGYDLFLSSSSYANLKPITAKDNMLYGMPGIGVKMSFSY